MRPLEFYSSEALSTTKPVVSRTLTHYTTAYQLSDRAALLYNIGVCHDRLEHKAEAVAFYDRFVTALPDSPRAEIARSRAQILRDSIRPDEANPEDLPPDSSPPSSSPDGPDESSLLGPAISFAVGGAGLITFAVAGVVALGQFADAETHCFETGSCEVDALDSIDQVALIADIGLGVAIAGAIVGTIWILLSGDDEDSVQVGALVTPTTGGLMAEGTF